MKKLGAITAFIMAAFGLEAQTYIVDAEKSTVEWTGKKIGKVHNGTVALKEGSFTLEDDRFTEGTFLIDLNVMTDEDHPDPNETGRLIGHLKSDDFFSVDKYPYAKLEIASSGKFEGGEALVKANLTIKGKTHPIEFKVKRLGATYTSSLSFDRSLYDVRFGSDRFFDNLGDSAIDNIIPIDVTLIAQRQKLNSD
jgi:polyisoprenoid-binding protein YceI